MKHGRGEGGEACVRDARNVGGRGLGYAAEEEPKPCSVRIAMPTMTR